MSTGTKRTVHKGEKDSLGREIMISGQQLAGKNNASNRAAQVGSSVQYNNEEDIREVDVMKDNSAYGRYLRDDLPGELWTDITGGDTIDPGFASSEQFREFLTGADTVIKENNLVWEDENGEIMYDEANWYDFSEDLGRSLELSHDSYLHGNADLDIDHRDEEHKSVVDGLSNHFEDSFDEFSDLIWDGNEPSGWAGFVRNSKEAKKLISDEVDHYDIASLDDDNGVKINREAVVDRKGEIKASFLSIMEK